jgi:GNAT superfamily N-acetyltransferase
VTRIVPANEASWRDLRAVLGGANCHGDRCFCQRFMIRGKEWRSIDDVERARRLRSQTNCGHPANAATCGLVAFLDDEPVGWCRVERRSAFATLGQTPWRGRTERKDDDSVWAAACFIVGAGFRGQGITYDLARATVDFAQERGARGLEGYPMDPEPGKDVQWGELHVGKRSIFEAAGFTEVSRPSLRRVVMRIEF